MNIYKNYPGPGIEVDTIPQKFLDEHGYRKTDEIVELKGWPDPRARKYINHHNREIWIGESNE